MFNARIGRIYSPGKLDEYGVIVTACAKFANKTAKQEQTCVRGASCETYIYNVHVCNPKTCTVGHTNISILKYIRQNNQKLTTSGAIMSNGTDKNM